MDWLLSIYKRLKAYSLDQGGRKLKTSKQDDFRARTLKMTRGFSHTNNQTRALRNENFLAIFFLITTDILKVKNLVRFLVLKYI